MLGRIKLNALNAAYGLSVGYIEHHIISGDLEGKGESMNKHKNIGGIFPTLFDIPDMWRLNSTRCSGKLNLYFFWLYPIAVVFLIPFTILCFIEIVLTTNSKPIRPTPKASAD